MSSRKHFKEYLYFTGIFYNSVENFSSSLWKKLWKTLQAFSGLYLNIYMISGIRLTACAKLQKLSRKKNSHQK
jgi:hypothetical protein